MHRRLELCAALSLLLALLSYLHFDPASPVDPFFAYDPKPDATGERRAAMWREFELLRSNPWGTIDELTREGALKMQSRLIEKWPEEFPP